QQAQQQQIAAATAAGDEYRKANSERDGVSVTDSGLQYEVLVEGDGDKPTASDTVSVHYEGTLIGGKVFDSSIARGSPAEFGLNGVIPGWTEGLQLMNVGSKYRFVIPSDLAYGERGAGRDIGPGETLIFEVELLEIK
ncbi:MAG: FKBP-type peptidyl-prolyl cis-trans isomerase, partial [Pseudomonadota bacterium]